MRVAAAARCVRGRAQVVVTPSLRLLLHCCQPRCTLLLYGSRSRRLVRPYLLCLCAVVVVCAAATIAADSLGRSSVVVQVKTTNPDRYLVRPNQGIMSPGSLDVEVRGRVSVAPPACQLAASLSCAASRRHWCLWPPCSGGDRAVCAVQW